MKHSRSQTHRFYPSQHGGSVGERAVIAHSEERAQKLFQVVKHPPGMAIQSLKAGAQRQHPEIGRGKQSSYTKKLLQNMVERSKNVIPHRRSIDISPKIHTRSKSLNPHYLTSPICNLCEEFSNKPASKDDELAGNGVPPFPQHTTPAPAISSPT